ncbi:4-(cytidine 5'-diphospho)-2-C-methyl-D-erythritol kinase [Burkholderiaceae bacterium DAT-1]|nr:4-(cytidine 5'-diphospho)-2-C-methyl-D-erythritol kinase [Burkholderiaceae bacterium DAT-1]
MKPYFAPAKLNLFLHIIGQRADGYHLLQTVFRLLDHGDTVWIEATGDGEIIHENPLPGVPAESDLMVRAARLLQSATGTTRGCRLRIDKRLPMGGGVGGGSSDAATVLKALNTLWDIHMPLNELMSLGVQLGADVPVFIFGKDAFAEGVGEQLQEITLPNQAYIVLRPPVHISTQEIFREKSLTRDSKPVTIAAFPDLLMQGETQKVLRNDMQAVAVGKYPVVGEYIEWLGQYAPAMMTGSGACVFAAFNTRAEADKVFSLKPESMSGFVAECYNAGKFAGFADQ